MQKTARQHKKQNKNTFVLVSPEVGDTCRGADPSSRVDNQVLRFFNQLS